MTEMDSLPDDDQAVYVISIAAELSGMHPQAAPIRPNGSGLAWTSFGAWSSLLAARYRVPSKHSALSRRRHKPGRY